MKLVLRKGEKTLWEKEKMLVHSSFTAKLLLITPLLTMDLFCGDSRKRSACPYVFK